MSVLSEPRNRVLMDIARDVRLNHPNRGTAGIVFDCAQRGFKVTTDQAFDALCIVSDEVFSAEDDAYDASLESDCA